MPPEDMASTLAAACVRSRVRQTLGTFTLPVLKGEASCVGRLSVPVDMVGVWLLIVAVGTMLGLVG